MQSRSNRSAQGGFSMLEMLMAAFILAVGILGLSMLQVMSLRASRGSRSMSTAVLVAEQILDQVELEGRVTWLNLTGSAFTAPSAPTTIQYVNQAGPVVRTFTIKGRAPLASAPDPADANPYFTATLVRTNPPSGAIGAAGGQQIHDFRVTVSFNDSVDAATSSTVIQRSVVLTRRILHG